MSLQNNDIVRITMRQIIGSTDVQNVFHARYTGTTITDYTAPLAGLAIFMGTQYGYIEGYLTDNLTPELNQMWNLTRDENIGTFGWDTYAGGTGTGAVAPWQICACVLFGTGQARSQGRKFLGPIIASRVNDDSELDGAITLALLNWAYSFVLGASFGSGVLDFGNWNPTLSRFVPWTTISVSPFARNQRRRMPDRGS